MNEVINILKLKEAGAYVSGQVVCEVIGCTGDTLRSWRQSGLPYYELMHNSCYYKPKDIIEFIESKRKVMNKTQQPSVKENRPIRLKKEKKKITLDDLKAEPDRLLKSSEMYQLLSISSPMLRRLRAENKLKYYYIGRMFKYKASDVLQFMEDNEFRQIF